MPPTSGWATGSAFPAGRLILRSPYWSLKCNRLGKQVSHYRAGTL